MPIIFCMGSSNSFGGRLKAIMSERNLTDSQLANLLKMSKKRVNLWTHDQNTIHFNKLAKLAEQLETTPNYLLGFDDEIHKLAAGLAHQILENRKIKVTPQQFAEFYENLCDYARTEKRIGKEISLFAADSILMKILK